MGDRMTTLDDLARVERELREYVSILESHLYNQPDRASWVENKADTIAAFIAAQGWRPIETAPKDWTHVLVVDDGTVGEARWTDDGWYWGSDHSSNPWSCLLNPTHWMPLPAAPSGTKEKDNASADVHS